MRRVPVEESKQTGLRGSFRSFSKIKGQAPWERGQAGL
jgi:hypothetical protein